jgi:tetratricopeptide (TPR) repeat protein
MDVANTLKTLLKEANIYQTQGLLVDARKKYEAAAAVLHENGELKNREELLAGISRKIASLEKVVNRVEKGTIAPDLSTSDKDIIKKLFSVSASHDPEDAAMEGAMALAKFGLFDRAIQEFELLLNNPDRRIEVAKQILRCRMAIRLANDPMVQYNQWVNNALFTKEQLETIKIFLERAYGVISSVVQGGVTPLLSSEKKAFPQPATASTKAPEKKAPSPPAYDPYEDSYEDVLDILPNAGPTIKAGTEGPAGGSDAYDELLDKLIPDKKPKKELSQQDFIEDYIDYVSSVSIPVSIGPRTGQSIDVPVNLQTADTVNLIIPVANKDLIAMLKKGARIEKIKLNSPISVSNGAGIVIAAALIDQGPRKGDYSVDLKIES